MHDLTNAGALQSTRLDDLMGFRRASLCTPCAGCAVCGRGSLAEEVRTQVEVVNGFLSCFRIPTVDTRSFSYGITILLITNVDRCPRDLVVGSNMWCVMAVGDWMEWDDIWSPLG